MSNESIRHGSTAEERRKVLLSKLNPLTMPLRYQIGLLGVVGLALLPTMLFPSEMGPYILLMYFMMFAMSWDVVSGYTGQLSFGHAFFFAIGGYGTAVLQMQHGVNPLLATFYVGGIPIPFPGSIFIATFLAALGGVIVGVPALRLRGPYLSLVTLIVPVIFVKLLILFNEGLSIPLGPLGSIPVAPGGLGGTSGLSGLPRQLFGPSGVITVEEFRTQALAEYYFSFGLMLLVFTVLFAVTRSSAGDVFTAIREDENAVSAAGLNPAKFKLFAFVLSGAVGGLAGAALVHMSIAAANPQTLLGGAGQAGSPIALSINVIVMAILGGMGTIVGPVVGGALFAASEQAVGALDFTIPVLNKEFSSVYPLPLLALAMLAIVFVPDGAVPENVHLGRKILATYRGEEVEGDSSASAETPSAVGQVVDNYREDLDEMTGNDDGGRNQ